MSAPTIVDSPIADKPLVDPEWQEYRPGCWKLWFVDQEMYAYAAHLKAGETYVWHATTRRIAEVTGDLRPLEDRKRFCEQALRDAGYRFAGESTPCSNPACDCGDMRPDDRITLPDCVDGIETLPDGARQSKLAERCDLLPPHALLAVSRVMHEGAAKYGERNWETIPTSSHLNHAVRHVLLYLSGDRQEKHLEHAACRALMALDKYLRDADAPP